MIKLLTVKVENQVVTIAIDTLSERALNAEIGRLNHKKYLLEKKKASADMQSMGVQKEISELDRQILALSSDEAKRLIAEAQAKKELDLLKRHMAQLNAEEIMLQFFGQDVHDKFMENREYTFTDKTNQTWKITTEGTVLKQLEDGSWEPKCLIRPHELPLPDFIVAAITSVKHQPEAFANPARQRR